jgi:hypothetical protein
MNRHRVGVAAPRATAPAAARLFAGRIGNNATLASTLATANSSLSSSSAVDVKTTTTTATDIPAVPQLSPTVWDGSATYGVVFNNWWGQSATHIELFENGRLVGMQDLTDVTPNPQTAQFNFENKANGTYTYVLVSSNSAGTSTSAPLTVRVTAAAAADSAPAATEKPAVPQLSQTAWDGESSYYIMWNMWWGPNATSWVMRENGKIVASGNLEDHTPNAQSGRTGFVRPNGTYEYKVELQNRFGVTESNPLTYVVRTGAPVVPTALTLTALDPNTIDISWAAMSDAASYDLEVDGVMHSSMTSPFSLRNLQPNTTHTVRIRARNLAGVSNWSDASMVTTPALQTDSVTAPAQVQGVQVEAKSPTSIAISWVPVVSASSYELSVLTGDVTLSGNSSTSAAAAVSSPWIIEGLTPNTTYKFAVRGLNATGAGVWSQPAAISTPPADLAPPTGLTAVVMDANTIAVTWSTESAIGATYDLLIDAQELVTNAPRGYLDTNLLPQSTHTYQVRMRLGNLISAWSTPPVSATTPSAPTPPPPPTVPVPVLPSDFAPSVNSSTQVTVRWTPMVGLAYDLQIDGKIVADVTSPFAHNNLDAGSTHTYAIRARNTAGVTTAWSTTVAATTTPPPPPPSSTLTKGEVADSKQRYAVGYWPSWSTNWFDAWKWDGTKRTDDEIYDASNLARVPGVWTHIMLSFGKPDFAWGGAAADTFAGTGLEFSSSPKQIKEVIRLLHALNRKVILALGGANYNNWGPLATEAGKSGPIKAALAKFIDDMGIDGMDVDFEIMENSDTVVAQYANCIQAMKEALLLCTTGAKVLTLAAWSTGSDYTADLSSEPGYPGVPSYWGGAAGRERKTFKSTVSSSPLPLLVGKTIGSLLDVVSIMSYDVRFEHYDPTVAYAQYRTIVPATTVVCVGLEIPPEGWPGGILVINNSQAGATGTILLADQYGKTPVGPYSVERSIGRVLMSTTNPKDGAMLWHLLLNQPMQAGAFPSATATTVGQKLAQMFRVS